MTTIFITKVHDKNCDICQHMAKHDRATFESFPEVEYSEVLLDDVINSANTGFPLLYHRLYQCLETHCLNPDYSIDLPVYVALSKTGGYLGHVQGANTVAELRDGVKTFLETSDNSSE